MANNNIRALSDRKGLENNLFEKIAHLSKSNASEESFQELSKKFMIDDSVVFGTASFYDFIKEDERNKSIRVCNGTACMVAGTQENIQSLLEDNFQQDKIGHVACIGHCHSNGAVMYKDHTYSVKSDEDFRKIRSLKENERQLENSYHIDSNTEPILTGKIDDLSSFFKLAATFKDNKAQIISELKESKLRGRGGAGFPFWFKLDAVCKEINDQK